MDMGHLAHITVLTITAPIMVMDMVMGPVIMATITTPVLISMVIMTLIPHIDILRQSWAVIALIVMRLMQKLVRDAQIVSSEMANVTIRVIHGHPTTVAMGVTLTPGTTIIDILYELILIHCVPL